MTNFPASYQRMTTRVNDQLSVYCAPEGIRVNALYLRGRTPIQIRFAQRGSANHIEANFVGATPERPAYVSIGIHFETETRDEQWAKFVASPAYTMFKSLGCEKADRADNWFILPACKYESCNEYSDENSMTAYIVYMMMKMWTIYTQNCK